MFLGNEANIYLNVFNRFKIKGFSRPWLLQGLANRSAICTLTQGGIMRLKKTSKAKNKITIELSNS